MCGLSARPQQSGGVGDATGTTTSVSLIEHHQQHSECLHCSAAQRRLQGATSCGSRARIISIISIIMIARRRARPCGDEMAVAASGQNSRRQDGHVTRQKQTEEAAQKYHNVI